MDSDTSDTVGDSRQNTPCDHPFHGYAGFWKRYAAFCIDIVILVSAALGLIFLAVSSSHPISGVPPSVLYLLHLINFILMPCLYFAGFESSSFQATPGKMVVGIKVTDMDGNRISFGRATGRHFSKILSNLSFSVGYLMAAFTRKKQGLHDIGVECLVVNKSKPRWVKTAIAIVASVIGSMIIFFVFILLPATSGSALRSKMISMIARAKDIYVAIVGANTEREPLGLEPV